jgi:protein-S-isoprenylcysteine O-methyltransferase Ste14
VVITLASVFHATCCCFVVVADLLFILFWEFHAHGWPCDMQQQEQQQTSTTLVSSAVASG